MLIVLHPYRARELKPEQSLDMFEAELPDGTRLKPIRSVMYATARALRERGVPDTELVEYRHAGSKIIAASGTVGELAQWTVTESDTDGLQKRPYVPFPTDRYVGRSGSDWSAGV